MTTKPTLEDFGTSSLRPQKRTFADTVGEDVEAERLRKAAFEDGYASGWEDAQAADSAAHKHIDAEFQRCIQDLGFTYHEAVGKVRAELTGFIEAIFDTLLPSVMKDAFQETVVQKLIEQADAHLAPSIELRSHPSKVQVFEDLLGGRNDLAITVQEEATLSANQAYIKFIDHEVLVDLDSVVSVARAQLDALTQEEVKEVANG